jgi:Superinfection immunity protein
MQDTGNALFMLFMLAVSIGLYMLPAIWAWQRGHPQTMAIAILDLFLAWSILGWVIALVWAATAIKEADRRDRYDPYQMPIPPRDETRAARWGYRTATTLRAAGRS